MEQEISLVKVLWRNHETEEATWEAKKLCGINIPNYSMKEISRMKFS